jgi:L-rhamnose isomerase
MTYRIPPELIAAENGKLAGALDQDFEALGRSLKRRGVDIEAIVKQVAAFAVAVPTWGVGTGGTRFARFPGPGEPRDIFDKLEDCATIQQLTKATPTVSPHFPWDKVSDYAELRQRADELAFDRYLASASQIYAALPADWQVFLEHKFYEPAFYSTVIADWGSSYLAATELGPKAKCLVDLGHHAPNTNIEQIVARLIRFGKLAGFHFNDARYGDDDLDSGSVDPFRLFLIFNELVDAARRQAPGFSPAYMIDQSHNVTDPIESLMHSAMELQRAYAQALIVDRKALLAAQEENDALQAHRTLKVAYTSDVGPVLAEARRRGGGAIDPIAVYRAANYRARKTEERPERSGGSRSGIV